MSNRGPPPKYGGAGGYPAQRVGSGGLAPSSQRPYPAQLTAPSQATSASAVLNTIGTAILHTGKAGALDLDEDDEYGGAPVRRLKVANAGNNSDSDDDRGQRLPPNPNTPPNPGAPLPDFALPAMDRRPTFIPSKRLGPAGGDDPTSSQTASQSASNSNMAMGSASPPMMQMSQQQAAAQTSSARRGGGGGAQMQPAAPGPAPASGGGGAVSGAQGAKPGEKQKAPTPFGLIMKSAQWDQVQKIKRAINAANRLPPEREQEKDERLDAAFIELTTLCSDGNAEAQYYLAREFGKDEKWEEALKYFIVASRAGHIPSAYQAGLCFENRRGFDSYNPTYVSKMYNQAAAAGYLPAMYRMSDPSVRPGVASSCLMLAKGLEKEDEETVDGDYLTALYEVAGEGGYAKARFRLGQIFELGLFGIVPDPHRAYRYYRKAADHFDGEAMHRLALLFEKGELNISVDPSRSFRYYARASERGIVPAINRMGEIFERGQLGTTQNVPQALKCFKDAAHRGNVDAMHNLARIHLEGLYGQNKGLDGALEPFQKAARKNKPEALYALGNIYEKGMYGVPVNADQAMTFYEQGADRGSTKAMIRLGKMYEFGEFVRASDPNRAVSYYKMASDAGDAQGHFLLAGWYFTGNSWLVKKNPEEAFKLLKKAVSGGWLDGAEYRLGSFYEHGTGTPADMDTAVFHYRSAAQRGDPSALRKLAALGLSISGAVGASPVTANGRR